MPKFASSKLLDRPESIKYTSNREEIEIRLFHFKSRSGLLHA
jgi:hypothetical protein